MKKEIEGFRDKMKETGIKLIKSGEDASVEINAYGAAKLFLTAAAMAQELLEYKDSAEFEARVSENILVKRDSLCDKDEYGNCKRRYPMGDNCSACMIKFARLSVEAEMEAEGK